MNITSQKSKPFTSLFREFQFPHFYLPQFSPACLYNHFHWFLACHSCVSIWKTKLCVCVFVFLLLYYTKIVHYIPYFAPCFLQQYILKMIPCSSIKIFFVIFVMTNYSILQLFNYSKSGCLGCLQHFTKNTNHFGMSSLGHFVFYI